VSLSLDSLLYPLSSPIPRHPPLSPSRIMTRLDLGSSRSLSCPRNIRRPFRRRTSTRNMHPRTRPLIFPSTFPSQTNSVLPSSLFGTKTCCGRSTLEKLHFYSRTGFRRTTLSASTMQTTRFVCMYTLPLSVIVTSSNSLFRSISPLPGSVLRPRGRSS
jgi:hypothetical protein